MYVCVCVCVCVCEVLRQWRRNQEGCRGCINFVYIKGEPPFVKHLRYAYDFILFYLVLMCCVDSIFVLYLALKCCSVSMFVMCLVFVYHKTILFPLCVV